jgi:hypothetical protein
MTRCQGAWCPPQWFGKVPRKDYYIDFIDRLDPQFIEEATLVGQYNMIKMR